MPQNPLLIDGFNTPVVKTATHLFANLPNAAEGSIATVTDSTTNTWGATIAGGGSYTVLAWMNGAGNWTVVGK